MNYNKALMTAQILNPTIRYRGCLVTLVPEGYKIGNYTATSIWDLDRYIDARYEALSKSIANGSNKDSDR